MEAGTENSKGRDLRGLGRFPPTPRYAPIQFYTVRSALSAGTPFIAPRVEIVRRMRTQAVRKGDPELLAHIMSADWYFVTQAREELPGVHCLRIWVLPESCTSPVVACRTTGQARPSTLRLRTASSTWFTTCSTRAP